MAAAMDAGAAFAYPRISQFGEATWLSGRLDTLGYLPFEPSAGARQLHRRDGPGPACPPGRPPAATGSASVGWEDYDLWCRLVELGLFGVQVNENLAGYRVHGGSMLHTDTHADGRLAAVRAAMTAAHPWLRLLAFETDEAPAFVPPAEVPRPVVWSGAAPVEVPAGEQPASAAVSPDTDTADRAGAPVPTSTTSILTDRASRLAELLPLLRCPVTGGPLAPVEGGLAAPGGPVWPLVAGRPQLFPGHHGPVLQDLDHVGNPLPDRARALVRALTGRGLHLSGGGTTTGGDQIVELDAAVFGPTDVVGDAHHLPFGDADFDLVVAMNAFEHYRDPSLRRRGPPGPSSRWPRLPAHRVPAAPPRGARPLLQLHPLRPGTMVRRVRDARPLVQRQLPPWVHAGLAPLRGRGGRRSGRCRLPGDHDGGMGRSVA